MTTGGNVWELPGPRRFVESIVADLRDGASVVVAAPPHCPAGLFGEVYSRIGNDFSWQERDLVEVDEPESTADPHCVIASMVEPGT